VTLHSRRNRVVNHSATLTTEYAKLSRSHSSPSPPPSRTVAGRGDGAKKQGVGRATRRRLNSASSSTTVRPDLEIFAPTLDWSTSYQAGSSWYVVSFLSYSSLELHPVPRLESVLTILRLKTNYQPNFAEERCPRLSRRVVLMVIRRCRHLLRFGDDAVRWEDPVVTLLGGQGCWAHHVFPSRGRVPLLSIPGRYLGVRDICRPPHLVHLVPKSRH
jgi:hypothetical protein